MPSNELALAYTAIFMAGLFFLLVVLPWKTVYQRRLKHGLPLLEQKWLVPARLDFIDVIMTLVIYFGVQVVGIVVVAENPDPQDNTNHFLQTQPIPQNLFPQLSVQLNLRSPSVDD